MQHVVTVAPTGSLKLGIRELPVTTKVDMIVSISAKEEMLLVSIDMLFSCRGVAYLRFGVRAVARLIRHSKSKFDGIWERVTLSSKGFGR